MADAPDHRREFNRIVGASADGLSSFEVMRRAGEPLTEACLQDQINRVELLLSQAVTLTPFRAFEAGRDDWRRTIDTSVSGLNDARVVAAADRRAVAEYLNTVVLAPDLGRANMKIIMRGDTIVIDANPDGARPAATPKPAGFDDNALLQAQVSLIRTSLGGLQREWGRMRTSVTQTSAVVASMTSAYMLERSRRAAGNDLAGVQNIDRLIAIELFHDEGFAMWQDMMELQRNEIGRYVARFGALPADVAQQLQNQEAVLRDLKAILEKRMANFRMLARVRAFESDAPIDLANERTQIFRTAQAIVTADPRNPLAQAVGAAASERNMNRLGELRRDWQDARDDATKQRLKTQISAILNPIRDAVQRYDLSLLEDQAKKMWTGPTEVDERIARTRGIAERAMRFIPELVERMAGGPNAEQQPVLRPVFVTRTLFLAHGQALADAQDAVVRDRRPDDERRAIGTANNEFISRFLRFREVLGRRRRNITRILVGEGHLDLPHISPEVIPATIGQAVMLMVEAVRGRPAREPVMDALNHHCRVILRTEADRQKFEYALNERLAGSPKMVKRTADNNLAVVDRALPTTDLAAVTTLVGDLDAARVPSLDALNTHLQGLRTEEEQRTFLYALNIRLAGKGKFAVRNVAANLNACTIQLISRPPTMDIVPEALIPSIQAVLRGIIANPAAPVVDLAPFQRHLATLRGDPAKDRYIDAVNGWLAHTSFMIMRRLDAGAGRRTDVLELHQRPSEMQIGPLDQRSIERLATTRNESINYELDYITQIDNQIVAKGLTLEEFLDWYFFGVRLQGAVEEQNEQAMQAALQALMARRGEGENIGWWRAIDVQPFFEIPHVMKPFFPAGRIMGEAMHDRRMREALRPMLVSLGLPLNYFELNEDQKREAMKNCPRMKDLGRIIAQYRNILEPLLLAMRGDSTLLRDLCNATDASRVLRPKDLALTSATRRPSWWAESEENDITMAKALHARAREINGGSDDIFQYFDTPAEVEALRSGNIAWWPDRTRRPTDADIRRNVNFEAPIPVTGEARKRLLQQLLPAYFAMLGRVQRRSDVRGAGNTMTDAAIRERLTVPADANDDVKQRMREEAKWVYERLLQRKDEIDELYAPLHGAFRYAVDRNVRQHVDMAEVHRRLEPKSDLSDFILPIWLYWVGPAAATSYGITRLLTGKGTTGFSKLPYVGRLVEALPGPVRFALRRIVMLPGEPVALLADVIRGTPGAIDRYRLYRAGVNNPQSIARRLATEATLPLAERQALGRSLCPKIEAGKLNAAIADVHAFKNAELRTAYAELDAAKATKDPLKIREAQRKVYEIIVEKRNRLVNNHAIPHADANRLVRSGVCGLEAEALAARLEQMGAADLAREIRQAARGAATAERGAGSAALRTLPEGSMLNKALNPKTLANMTQREFEILARELRNLSPRQLQALNRELATLSHATPGAKQMRPLIQLRSAAAETGHAAELLRIGRSAAVVLDIAMVALEIYLLYEAIKAYNKAVEQSQEQKKQMRQELKAAGFHPMYGQTEDTADDWANDEAYCTINLQSIDKGLEADVDEALRNAWTTGAAAAAGVGLTILAATGAMSGGVTIIVGLVIIGIQLQVQRIWEKMKEEDYKKFIDNCPVWLLCILGTYATVKMSPNDMLRKLTDKGIELNVMRKMMFMIWIQKMQADPSTRALLAELLGGKSGPLELQKFYDDVFVPDIFPAWQYGVFTRKEGRPPDFVAADRIRQNWQAIMRQTGTWIPEPDNDRKRMAELVKDHYLFDGWVIGLGDIRTQSGAKDVLIDTAIVDGAMAALPAVRMDRYWEAYKQLILNGDRPMAENAHPDAPGAAHFSTVVRMLGQSPYPSSGGDLRYNRTLAGVVDEWIESNRGDRSVRDFVRMNPDGPPRTGSLHTRVSSPDELYACIDNPVQRLQLLRMRRGRPGTVDTASWAPGYRAVDADTRFVAQGLVHGVNGLSRPMVGINYLEWSALYPRMGGVHSDEGQRAHELCITRMVQQHMRDKCAVRDTALSDLIFAREAATDRPVVTSALSSTPTRERNGVEPSWDAIRGWCKDLYTTGLSMNDVLPDDMPESLGGSMRRAFSRSNLRAVAFQGAPYSEGMYRRAAVNIDPGDNVKHYALHTLLMFDDGRGPPYYARRTLVMRRVGDGWRPVYGATQVLQESQLSNEDRSMLVDTVAERNLRITTDAMERSNADHRAAPENLDRPQNRFAEKPDIAAEIFSTTRHRAPLFIYPPSTDLGPRSTERRLLEQLTERTPLNPAGEFQNPAAYYVEFRTRRDGTRMVIEALSTVVPTAYNLRRNALVTRQAAVAYVTPDAGALSGTRVRIDTGPVVNRFANQDVNRSLWLQDAPSVLYRGVAPADVTALSERWPDEHQENIRARVMRGQITGASNRANARRIDATFDEFAAHYGLLDEKEQPLGFASVPNRPGDSVFFGENSERVVLQDRLPDYPDRRLQLCLRYETTRGTQIRPMDVYFPAIPTEQQLRAYNAVITRDKERFARSVGARVSDIGITYLTSPARDGHDTFIVSDRDGGTQQYTVSSLNDLNNRYDLPTRRRLLGYMTTPSFRREDNEWKVDAETSLLRVLRYVASEVQNPQRNSMLQLVERLKPAMESAPDPQMFLQRLIEILLREGSVRQDNIDRIVTAPELLAASRAIQLNINAMRQNRLIHVPGGRLNITPAFGETQFFIEPMDDPDQKCTVLIERMPQGNGDPVRVSPENDGDTATLTDAELQKPGSLVITVQMGEAKVLERVALQVINERQGFSFNRELPGRDEPAQWTGNGESVVAAPATEEYSHLMLRRPASTGKTQVPNSAWGTLSMYGRTYLFRKLNVNATTREEFSIRNAGSLHAYPPIAAIERTIAAVSRSIGRITLDETERELATLWTEFRRQIGRDNDGSQPITTLSAENLEAAMDALTLMERMLSVKGQQRALSDDERAFSVLLSDCDEELHALELAADVRRSLTTPRNTPEPGRPGFDYSRYEAPIRDIVDLFLYRETGVGSTIPRNRAIRQLTALYWELGKDRKPEDAQRLRKEFLERIYSALQNGALTERSDMLSRTRGTQIPEQDKRLAVVTAEILDRVWVTEALRIRYNAVVDGDQYRVTNNGKTVAFRSSAGGIQYSTDGGRNWRGVENSITRADVGDSAEAAAYFNNTVLPGILPGSMTEERKRELVLARGDTLLKEKGAVLKEFVYTMTVESPGVQTPEDAPVGQRRTARGSSGNTLTFEKKAGGMWDCVEPEVQRGLSWGNDLIRENTIAITTRQPAAVRTTLQFMSIDHQWNYRVGTEGRWVSVLDPIAPASVGGRQDIADQCNNEILSRLYFGSLWNNPALTAFYRACRMPDASVALERVRSRRTAEYYQQIQMILPPEQEERERDPDLPFEEQAPAPQDCYARFIADQAYTIVIPARGLTPPPAAVLQAGRFTPAQRFRFGAVRDGETELEWNTIGHIRDLSDNRIPMGLRRQARLALTTPRAMTDSPDTHRQSLQNILLLCDYDVGNNHRGELSHFGESALAMLQPMYLRAVNKQAFLERLVTLLTAEGANGTLNLGIIDSMRRDFERAERNEQFIPEIDPSRDTTIDLGTCRVRVSPESGGRSLRFTVIAAPGEREPSISFMEHFSENLNFGIYELRDGLLPDTQWSKLLLMSVSQNGRIVADAMPIRIRLTGPKLAERNTRVQQRRDSMIRHQMSIVNALAEGGDWEEVSGRFLRSAGWQKKENEWTYNTDREKSVGIRFRAGMPEFRSTDNVWRALTPNVTAAECGGLPYIAYNLSTYICSVVLDLRYRDGAFDRFVGDVNSLLPDIAFTGENTVERWSRVNNFGGDNRRRMLPNKEGILRVVERERGKPQLELLRTTELRRECDARYAALSGVRGDMALLRRGIEELNPSLALLRDIGSPFFDGAARTMNLDNFPGYILQPNCTDQSLAVTYAPFTRMRELDQLVMNDIFLQPGASVTFERREPGRPNPLSVTISVVRTDAGLQARYSFSERVRGDDDQEKLEHVGVAVRTTPQGSGVRFQITLTTDDSKPGVYSMTRGRETANLFSYGDAVGLREADRSRNSWVTVGRQPYRYLVQTINFSASDRPEDAPPGQRRTARSSSGTMMTFVRSPSLEWNCVEPEKDRGLTWSDDLVRRNTVTIENLPRSSFMAIYRRNNDTVERLSPDAASWEAVPDAEVRRLPPVPAAKKGKE